MQVRLYRSSISPFAYLRRSCLCLSFAMFVVDDKYPSLNIASAVQLCVYIVIWSINIASIDCSNDLNAITMSDLVVLYGSALVRSVE